jgi:bacterial/archaeal transporter family-2 protein
MTKILFLLYATAAGVASVVQSAANAGLASRIGLGSALVANTLIVLVGTFVVYFAEGAHRSPFSPDVPWSLYVGGVCGFAFLLSLAFVFPRIGAAVAIALVVLGQGAAALAIDHYGLLGMPREPVTPLRIAGLVLVGSGVLLIRA